MSSDWTQLPGCARHERTGCSGRWGWRRESGEEAGFGDGNQDTLACGKPKLLIAPSLSEVLVQHCRMHRVNCLDLNGRQWIRAEGVVVDRRPIEQRQFRPAQTAPDPFQPKSSRLVRALLANRERHWTQKELRERTGLSPGLVSRLVRHLENEGLLAQDERKVSVSHPDGLLDQWARVDNWAKRTTLRQYSLLGADLDEVARRLAAVYPEAGRLAFTQWFAANLRHPYTTPPVVSAYVPLFPEEKVERELGARPVADGGTLWLATRRITVCFAKING